MSEQDSINEIFFKFLLRYKFEEKDLDYSVLDKHKIALKTMYNVTNASINVFDICKREVVFYSSNFGALLGYVQSDYENNGQQFFADKIHPEDKLKLSLQGISTFKLLYALSNEENRSFFDLALYKCISTFVSTETSMVKS